MRSLVITAVSAVALLSGATMAVAQTSSGGVTSGSERAMDCTPGTNDPNCANVTRSTDGDAGSGAGNEATGNTDGTAGSTGSTGGGGDSTGAGGGASGGGASGGGASGGSGGSSDD